jgi:hypothetical protein
MKQFLFIPAFLILSDLNAQMCPCEFGGSKGAKTLRNEVNFNLVNAQEELINFTSKRSVYVTNYTNGILFKHHFNKFSARLGFDYVEHSYRYEASTDQFNYNLNNGKSFTKNFRLGVEKSLFEGKLQPFFAADIIYSRGRYNGITEGYGDFMLPYRLSYAFNSTAYGLSPALGLKYRPFRRFSITAETAFSFIHYKTYGSREYPPRKALELLTHPLRMLSFNYHF